MLATAGSRYVCDGHDRGGAFHAARRNLVTACRFPLLGVFIKSCSGLATAVVPMLVVRNCRDVWPVPGERISTMPTITWLVWPALFSAGTYAWTLALGAQIRSGIAGVVCGTGSGCKRIVSGSLR